MAFYFFWCLGGESRGCCPGRRDALGEPGGGSDRSEAQGCSLAASTPVLGGRGGTSHVCRRQNLKPWLARGRNEAEKAEVWGWRRSAEGGVARQPRVGFFFCCRDLSGKMLRGPGAPPNPQKCCPRPRCGVRGVGRRPDSSAEQMDLHNNNLALSVLGAGQRLEGMGTCPSLEKHLRNCVVRPLRGSGRCCLRWGFCLSIGCFGRFA